MPKTYRATFLLGQTSDTEDIEGNVHELPDPPLPTAEQIQAALSRFVGTIEQVPPAFSALKVAGERAYDLARQGRTVELAARPVEIHELKLVSYAYPELTLLIRCGSGTYVRSLGRDLARSLGTDAVMSALVRESIGPFALAGAVDGNRLTAAMIATHLLSPLLAVSDLPRCQVTAPEAQRLALGQSIENRWLPLQPESAAVDSEGQLIAIVRPDRRQHPAREQSLSGHTSQRSRQRLRGPQVGEQVADLLVGPGLELAVGHERFAAGAQVVDFVAGERDVLAVGPAEDDHVRVLVGDEAGERAAVVGADDVVLEAFANLGDG